MEQTDKPEYQLEFVDYTYAECCGNVIRIHKDLPMYSPQLYNHALRHEIGHLNKNVWQDLMWDIQDLFNLNIHIKSWQFYFKHPKLIKRMVFPIHFNIISKEIEVNYVLIITYIAYIVFVYFFFYL